MNTTTARTTLTAKIPHFIYPALRRYMDARESGTTREFVEAETALRVARAKSEAQERIRLMQRRLACARHLAEVRADNEARDRKRTLITRRVTFVDPIDG